MPEPMVNVTRQRRASREKPQGAPAAGRGGGKWWEMRLHRRVKKDFNRPARHRGLSWVKVVEHCRVQVRKSLEPLKALFLPKREDSGPSASCKTGRFPRRGRSILVPEPPEPGMQLALQDLVPPGVP